MTKTRRRPGLPVAEHFQEAKTGWALLRTGGNQSTGLEVPTRPTGVSIAKGAVRFALGPRGEARLLLPIRDRETVSDLVHAAAIDLNHADYSIGGRKVRFLDLTCRDGELESVFAEVADQIIARIKAGEGCISAARSTIEDFRSLVEYVSPSAKPLAVVAGLVGELLILDRMLSRSPDAWTRWRRPSGDRHDFRNGDISLEVKVSTSRNGLVTINGLDQLEAPRGGSLHLLHLVLEPTAQGDLGVATLGKGVQEKAGDPDGLHRVLKSLGCSDVEDEHWNQSTFRLESESLYEVTERFPRLVASMLIGGEAPPEVRSIRYRLDLSGAADLRKNPTESKYLDMLLT